MKKGKIIMIMGVLLPLIVEGKFNGTTLSIEEKREEKAEVKEKGTRLSIYVIDVDYYKWPILCSTIVVYATSPFNEYLLNMNNAPPKGERLASYKSIRTGWYCWSSQKLSQYVEEKFQKGDTIAFCLEIEDRNRGVCDIAWKLVTKENFYSQFHPYLQYNSTILYSCGDSWVTDGWPGGPNTNFGRDDEMMVCSCTLTTRSGTQRAYIQFYNPPTKVEEKNENKKIEFEVKVERKELVVYYSIVEKEEISLIVYDLLGRRVKSLATGIIPCGSYEARWRINSTLSTGYYFVVLKVGRKCFVKKFLLL
jgi:hypothetical protein